MATRHKPESEKTTITAVCIAEVLYDVLRDGVPNYSCIYLFLTPNSRSAFRAGVSLNIHSFIHSCVPNSVDCKSVIMCL